jgi:hypothetical protein
VRPGRDHGSKIRKQAEVDALENMPTSSFREVPASRKKKKVILQNEPNLMANSDKENL